MDGEQRQPEDWCLVPPERDVPIPGYLPVADLTSQLAMTVEICRINVSPHNRENCFIRHRFGFRTAVRTEFCGRDAAGGLGFTAGHTGQMNLVSLVAKLRSTHLKRPEIWPDKTDAATPRKTCAVRLGPLCADARLGT